MQTPMNVETFFTSFMNQAAPTQDIDEMAVRRRRAINTRDRYTSELIGVRFQLQTETNPTAREELLQRESNLLHSIDALNQLLTQLQ